jgi:hypothetical protein
MGEIKADEKSVPVDEKASPEKPNQDPQTDSLTGSEALTSVEKPEDDTAKPVADGDPANYPHGIKLVTLIIALCLAVFLVALDQTIIATAIPRITDRFRSVDDIGW